MANLKHHPGMWMRDDAAAALNAYEDKYGVIQLSRAGATRGEQQEAIDRWNKGGAANRPPFLFKPADPPETSPHVIGGGIAFDTPTTHTRRAGLAEFGFVWYGAGDPVHYNFVGWKGLSTRGGYQDGSAELKSFQHKLIKMGHDLGKTGADGIWGPRTEAATLHEQRCAEKNGYPGGNVVDDGIPGPSINAYLDWWLVGRHAITPPPAPPIVGNPSHADIQAALNRHGYNLKVDNVWGKNSSNALADFQYRMGLVVDRRVGPKTRAALGI